MEKLYATIGAVVLSVAMTGCYTEVTYRQPHRSHSLQRSYSCPVFPGYGGRSYGVVRNRHGRVIRRHGAVWGAIPPIPHHPHHRR